MEEFKNIKSKKTKLSKKLKFIFKQVSHQFRKIVYGLFTELINSGRLFTDFDSPSQARRP